MRLPPSFMKSFVYPAILSVSVWRPRFSDFSKLQYGADMQYCFDRMASSEGPEGYLYTEWLLQRSLRAIFTHAQRRT